MQQFLELFYIDANAVKRLPEYARALIITICIIILLISLSVLGILLYRIFIETSDSAARTFFLGLTAIVGLPFLIWRTAVAHIQSNAARHQSEIALEGYFTGIFSISVEFLGGLRDKRLTIDNAETTHSVPNIEARLGAIYSLERLMKESPKDRRAILETLCAYIRNNSPLEISSEKQQREYFSGEWWPEPTRRTDVQAAITVIGRRDANSKKSRLALDLTNANLSGYDFSRLDLTKASFRNSCLRTGNFRKATLDSANFRMTNLDHVRMKFSSIQKAKLRKCSMRYAVISSTNFSNSLFESSSILQGKVYNCNFSGCDLTKEFISYNENLLLESREHALRSFYFDLVHRVAHFIDKNHGFETAQLSEWTNIGLQKFRNMVSSEGIQPEECS